MTSTLLRQYLVIVGGMCLAAWLIASTVRQTPSRVGPSSVSHRMSRLEAAARLTFGVELLLVAVLLLVGRVFSAPSVLMAASGWMLALGAVLLVTAALSGMVVATFIVVKWRQPRGW
jgi:hypothetical protein